MQLSYPLRIFFFFCLFYIAACTQASILTNPGVTLPPVQEIPKPSAKAIELNDQAVTTFLNAHIEKNMDGIHQSLKLLDEAVQVDPQYYQAYATKAGLLMDMQRYSEAVESFSKALQIKPSVGEFYIGRASALHKAGDETKAKEDCRFAIAAFNLRLAKNPEDSSRIDRAIAVFLLGYKKVALGEVIEILKKNPHDEVAQMVKTFIESGQDPWLIFDQS